MQLNTISNNNTVAHRVTTQPSNALSGAFHIQHFITGCNTLLLKSYSIALPENTDRKSFANLPDRLTDQLLTSRLLAEFEQNLKQHLQSGQTNEELLEFPYGKQSFRSLLSQLKKQLDKIEMTTQYSSRLSPLLEALKQFIRKHYDALPNAHDALHHRKISRIILEDLKVLRRSLPKKGSLLKKQSDKSDYEHERDDRIRNCNKRRKSAYENIQWLTKNCQKPLVIHLAFETKRPFNGLACNAKFQTAVPTHFVNQFLAARNKAQYKKTIFKGLKGYFRKLELMDSCHAHGGFITLVFDQTQMDMDPYKLGEQLVSLLAKMSPDDDNGGRKRSQYVFQSDAFFNPNYKDYRNLQPHQWIEKLTAVVNCYTHAEYFFERFKHPDEKAYYQGNLPAINPYTSGLCR